MAKNTYKYNPETLTFEKYKLNWKQKIFRALGLLSMTAVFSIFLAIVLFYVVPSPREKMLEIENEQYELQLRVMNKKLSTYGKVLDDLAQRDNDLYNVIFESEPIPENIWNGGTGGVDPTINYNNKTKSQLLKETNKKLNDIKKKIVVLSTEYDKIAALATNKEDRLSHIPAIQPIYNLDLRRLSSGFGYRIHPIYNIKKFHFGVDFTADKGTDIYATGDGVVIKAQRVRGFGNHVIIDHGYGYQTIYAHMSSIKVKKGQKIKRGELIGLVGNTGLSKGPHLHYEVVKDGVKVNPVHYFTNDLSADEYEQALILARQANQSFD